MFDVLRAEPKKNAVKVCLPLVIVTVISWFTTSIVNILYGKYGGLYFAAQGLIGVVISTISTIVNAVISSAWIKTAPYYTKENTQEKTSYFATSVYAIMLVEFVLLILCLVAKNYIFSIFHYK